MGDLVFRILKRAPHARGVMLYSGLKNELYFLPYWLDHYRRLGIGEFVILDDHSDDGSREFLLTQPDCTVLDANAGWGDSIDGASFRSQVRNAVPRHFGMNRWVLSVDADEFLILPPGFDSLTEFTACLHAHEISCCRALMIDFFPAYIADVRSDTQTSPFDLCPYFDAIAVEWPDLAHTPAKMSLDGVRLRLLRRLLATTQERPDWLRRYRFASVNKEPLLRWSNGAGMLDSHTSTVLPRNSVQVALAHFKFYPTAPEKIERAVASGVYWNNSVEYQFLGDVYSKLSSVPLAGPSTRTYRGPADLHAAGLVFCNVSCHAG